MNWATNCLRLRQDQQKKANIAGGITSSSQRIIGLAKDILGVRDWFLGVSARSWQPPQESMAQQDLEQKQTEAGRNKPTKKFPVMGIFFNLSLGGFEFVDLGIDSLEFLGVISSIIYASGHLSDFLKGVFIDIDGNQVIHH